MKVIELLSAFAVLKEHVCDNRRVCFNKRVP